MQICLDLRTGTGCGGQNRNDAAHCQNCGKLLRFAMKLHDPGTCIGSYRVLDLLGHGGFGAVYAADLPQKPNVRVALKETFDTDHIESFEREFITLSRLRHPNLPAYYDVFKADGNGYLVMELVPGQNLQDILSQKGSMLPEPQVLGFAVQLCEVLHFLHNQSTPIIHRDIKPANIRITPDGLIKLVDFGLYKEGTGVTASSRRGLTPAYAPLEQWGSSGQHTGPKSDIYSLGATLYHLLTGVTPPSATERISATNELLLSPRQYNTALSKHVAQSIVTAMSLMAKDRYSDMLVFKGALFGAVVQSTAGPLAQEAAPKASVESFPPQVLAPTVKRVKLYHAYSLPGHKGDVYSLSYSPNCQILASAGADKKVKFWRVADGTIISQLKGHSASVSSIAWSPDGKDIITGSSDSTARIWKISNGDTIVTLRHAGDVLAVDYSVSGRLVACGDRWGNVSIWDTINGSLIEGFKGSTKDIWSIAWHPKNYLLAYGDNLGQVILWDAEARRVVRTLRPHNDAVWSLAWSPDGTTLVSGSRDGKIAQIPIGFPLRLLEKHEKGVTSVAYSPDGYTIISGGLDGKAYIWDISTASVLFRVNHKSEVLSVAYGPNGKTVSIGTSNGHIGIWNVETS